MVDKDVKFHLKKKIKNIFFSYKDRSPLLENLNFEIS